MTCLTLALGVALPTTILNLQGVRTNFEHELRDHGANLMIVPRNGSSLDVADLAPLDRIARAGELDTYAPFLMLVATVEGRKVMIAGTRFAPARELYRWASVEGAWPRDASLVLMGTNVAAKLGRRPGDSITITTASARIPLRVAGRITTGGSEESQIFVDIDVARQLAGSRSQLSLIQGRAHDASEVSSLASALARAIPDAEVRTPLQVVRAEEIILTRLERLFLLLSGAILVACALGVFATVATQLNERRYEVGVMKALGADEKTVMRLLGAETLGVGLAGGLLGYGLGVLLAQAVSEQVFGTFVAPSALALSAGLLAGVGISFATSLVILEKAVRVNPAMLLRGE